MRGTAVLAVSRAGRPCHETRAAGQRAEVGAGGSQAQCLILQTERPRLPRSV